MKKGCNCGEVFKGIGWFILMVFCAYGFIKTLIFGCDFLCDLGKLKKIDDLRDITTSIYVRQLTSDDEISSIKQQIVEIKQSQRRTK